MLLDDKVAVIAGIAVIIDGGRRIGREIALTYARAGADVVIASRIQLVLDLVKSEIEALGRQAMSIAADIRHESQLVGSIAGDSLNVSAGMGMY